MTLLGISSWGLSDILPMSAEKTRCLPTSKDDVYRHQKMTRHLPMTGEKTRCLQTPKQWCLPTPKMMTRHLLMTGENTRCLQTPKQWCLPTPNKETHAGADMTLTGITKMTF